MPQIKIEYTANLPVKNIQGLVGHIHTTLVEKLPTQLTSCKTRIEKVSEFYVADGNPNNGFFHVEIRILTGRSEELKEQVATELLKYLKNTLSYIPKNITTQVTVEIAELGSVYLKTGL
jgi:5-carboxymethyl-2-hydroxymuconate isomerase